MVPSVWIPDDRIATLVPGAEIPKREVKLGRIAPKSRPPAPRLSKYLGPAMAVPDSVDYSEKAMAAIHRMYMNDTYGCCVISSLAHRQGVYSANDSDSGGVLLATDQEIVQMYNAWKAGPGDSGCVISDVLDNLRATGALMAGKRYKIDGYVSVNWTKSDQVKAALYLFGSLTLGINLPSAWANAPNGGVWDMTNSGIVGGHDVPAIGYNSTGVVIATWGGTRTITWAAFNSTRYLDECYVELAPKWYGDDKLAPSGFNVEKLKEDLDTIGGGSIPPIDPPGPPVPPIPPGPPSPPPPPGPVILHGQGQTQPYTFNVPNGIFGHTTVTIPGQTFPVAVNMPPATGEKSVNWWKLYADFAAVAADAQAIGAVPEAQKLLADLKALAEDLGIPL